MPRINQDLLILNNLSEIEQKDEKKVRTAILKAKWSDLNEIKWLWEWTITKLADNWITKLWQLKEMRKDEINKIITNPLAQRAIENVLQNN